MRMDFKEGFRVETKLVIKKRGQHCKLVFLLFSPINKHVLQVAPLLVGGKTAYSGRAVWDFETLALKVN